MFFKVWNKYFMWKVPNKITDFVDIISLYISPLQNILKN